MIFQIKQGVNEYLQKKFMVFPSIIEIKIQTLKVEQFSIQNLYSKYNYKEKHNLFWIHSFFLILWNLSKLNETPNLKYFDIPREVLWNFWKLYNNFFELIV